MLSFFSVFNPWANGEAILAAGNAQREITKKVRAIEDHLDDLSAFPLADREPPPYSLVDWNVAQNGRGQSVMVGPIYVGSALALIDTDFLRNIGAIITIIDPSRCPKEAAEEAIKESTRPGSPGKAHLYLPLNDDPRENISKYFDTSAQFIRYYQERGIPVLVHCMAGISRSATLVANYLMQKYHINTLQALDLLKRRRQGIRPNPGFIRQLIKQENK
jgi:hypothetical protein